MVAQRGTLNLVNGGGFLVLSLPVSALQGVDDDGDGRLSPAEMSAHVKDIGPQVQRGVQLLSPTGAMPLEGMLFSLSPPDNEPSAPAPHLVVMGRFALPAAWGPAAASGPTASVSAGLPLSLRVSLFGTAAEQRQLDLTVTRVPEVQHLRFEPGRESHRLFPSAGQVLLDHLVIGAEHVARGADHVLFLWVVVTAAAGWRLLLLTLTCFTLGHALTLTAGVLGGWSVPASVVEPAIALTIIGMAGLDRRFAQLALAARSDGVPVALGMRWPTWRMVLVFCCALIHGLALTGALVSLGLDRRHLGWSLLGFNLGVECGQLVALTLMVIAFTLWRSTAGFARHARAANMLLLTLGFILAGDQLAGYLTR